MKKRGKGLKIFAIVAGAAVVVVAGMIAYLMIGQDEVKRMAIENVDVSRIQNGTYEGTYSGYRWSDTVKVTVENGKITAIEPVNAPSFLDTANIDELTARVLARQTPQVDAVSGATVSSKAFLKAVENALTGAS